MRAAARPGRRMTDDLDRLRQTFTHALLLAGRQWRRAADAVAQGHGLSDATALPLVMIGRLDGAPRQTALAEAVGIEGPSLVRLLDQLAAAGLVRRAEDPSDRRAKVLSLTPAGEAAVAAIEAELIALRAAVFAEVAPADLEAACRVLRAVMRPEREPQP
jgi:MarR family transcriptional regulator for hemolysin